MVGIYFFFFQQHVGWCPCTILIRLWEFESPLSSWHAYRLQKNTWPGKNMQRGWGYTMCWQQRSPKKLISLPFPSPSFSPLCKSSLHMSFLFRPIPCGAMMQVRPLLSPRLKITHPKPTQLLKIVCLHQQMLGSFNTALCAERARKLCQFVKTDRRYQRAQLKSKVWSQVGMWGGGKPPSRGEKKAAMRKAFSISLQLVSHHFDHSLRELPAHFFPIKGVAPFYTIVQKRFLPKIRKKLQSLLLFKDHIWQTESINKTLLKVSRLFWQRFQKD